MMKRGIALIVLIVVAGQSLFCVDFRLGERQPAKTAVYNEERESVRLDRSLARFAPDSVHPEPMSSSSGSSEENSLTWWGLGAMIGGLACMALSFAFEPAPAGSESLGAKDTFFYGGVAFAGVGALFLLIGLAADI